MNEKLQLYLGDEKYRLWVQLDVYKQLQKRQGGYQDMIDRIVMLYPSNELESYCKMLEIKLGVGCISKEDLGL